MGYALSGKTALVTGANRGIGEAIVDALVAAGMKKVDEEIFPDKMSQGAGPAFFADPKGLERQVAEVPAAASGKLRGETKRRRLRPKQLEDHPMKSAVVLLAALAIAAATPGAQTLAEKQTAFNIERSLQRLPYYGVFDFLAFGVEKGVVTLQGYAYQGSLKSDAARAAKRVSGVDEVANKITVLPVSPNDDRIRWATFYSIYTDDFLSRYSPGGAMGARYDARQFARFPGMQPSGNYPIHIIVQNGRTMLLGIVDNESDKTIAGFKAREISGVFGVENELVVSKN